MPTIEYREGKDFPELPVREPILVKVIEAEFATEDNPFAKEDNDEPETRDVVKVVMECVDDEFTGSRIWSTFTASIHEKSKLRPFIQACSDHELTLDELKAFDTDDLVGARVYVIGEYNDKKDPDHKFLRPISYSRVKKSERAKTESKPEPKAERAASTRERATATAGRSRPQPEPEDPDEIPF